MTRKLCLALALMALVFTATANAQGILFVKNGVVGVNKSNPSWGLDIQETVAYKSRIEVTNNNGATANRTMLNLVNNGFPRFVMTDTSAGGGQWLMTGGGTFIFSKVGSGTKEIEVFSGGDVIIGGMLTEGSSRSIKTDFESVDSREVLDRLSEMPLQEWRYKHDAASERHFGPFAEDFHATFGLGSSPETISSLDTSGVAMAAVQGLYEIVKEKDQVIETLEARLADLERMVQEMQ
ncbi:MAG: tail fiber domain-containing protein [bacterium]|nr:tail fiber domain-containing protein [bacterium]